MLGRGFVMQAVSHPFVVVAPNVSSGAGDRVRRKVEPEVGVKLVLGPAVEALVRRVAGRGSLRDIGTPDAVLSEGLVVALLGIDAALVRIFLFASHESKRGWQTPFAIPNPLPVRLLASNRLMRPAFSSAALVLLLAPLGLPIKSLPWKRKTKIGRLFLACLP